MALCLSWWRVEPRVEPHVAPGGAEIALGVAAILAALLVSLTPGVLTIVAALKMKRLEAYGLAVAASILTIVATPPCLIGLPIGIWALVVLSQRNVRAAFAQNRKRSTGPASASPPDDPQHPYFSPSSTGDAGSTPSRSARKFLWAVIGLSAVAIVAYLGISHFAPYFHGRSRAQNDLEYQSWNFREGEGYYPASTFLDGVAYLYTGYPQDDWADGVRLSNHYVERWIAGYRAVVEDAGYVLKRTDTRPAHLPHPDSDPASPPHPVVEWDPDGLPSIERLGSSPAASVDVAEHPGGPWEARLPSGVTVELLGVAENPSKDQPWWQPHGSPLAERPYDWLGASVAVDKDEMAREFAVRLSNTPSEPVGVRWRVDPSLASSLRGRPELAASAADVRGVAVGIPASQPTADVHVGVAAGAWQTFAESQARGDVVGGKANVIFSPAEEEDASTTITVTHDLIGAHGEGPQVRVVAVGLGGREHHSERSRFGRAGKLSQLTVTFSKLSLKEVQAFHLQARPYQWAAFHNVSLQAGQETSESQTESDAATGP